MAFTDVKIVHFPAILSALLESMKSLESILTCLEYVGPVKARNMCLYRSHIHYRIYC